MVETARDAGIGFARKRDVGSVNGSNHLTEPGTASRMPETKGPKPSRAPLPIGRDWSSPLLTAQKPVGSRPLRLGQRLWDQGGLRGGPGRTRTSNQTVMSVPVEWARSKQLYQVLLIFLLASFTWANDWANDWAARPRLPIASAAPRMCSG